MFILDAWMFSIVAMLPWILGVSIFFQTLIPGNNNYLSIKI